MTNTMYIPEEIERALADAKRLVARIELVKRYADEAELQGLASDEAFNGADLVLLRGDFLLSFEVVDWRTARVRLTLSRIVEDAEDVRTDDLWSVELTEVPWQLFSVILEGAIKQLPNTES